MAAQSGRAWAAHWWEGQDQTWLDKNGYGVAEPFQLARDLTGDSSADTDEHG